MRNSFLECGKIVNTHGVAGELKCESWCDSPEVLASLSRVFIEDAEYRIESARVHKKMALLKLEGIDDVSAAMRLKNKVLLLDRDDFRLEDGEFFISDIIGLPVFDTDGREIGTLSDVLFLPASQVYVVKGEAEHMIPAVPEFLKSVDLNAGRITVSLIEGM